jgi:hypothetical protein
MSEGTKVSPHTKQLEDVVLSKLLRLNAIAQGIVAGILLGLGLFLATNWLVLKGGPVGPDGRRLIGPHLSLLSQFFIGYHVSFVGSLIGLAYGFATGFVGGYAVARLYNWIVDLREHR